MSGSMGPAGETVSMCSMRAGNALFGIDTQSIREVLGKTTTQPVPLAPAFLAGVVPYRGDVLATVSLRSLLGMEGWAGRSQVVVLDDEKEQGPFGLLVDCVDGVLRMGTETFEERPPALDARSTALFDGVYRMETGVMVRLNPQRLRPLQLQQSGLFDISRTPGHGVQR